MLEDFAELAAKPQNVAELKMTLYEFLNNAIICFELYQTNYGMS